MGVSLSYGLLGGLAIALLVAAVTDTRRRQIDNGLNLAIALCAPLFWWAQGLGLVDIGWQLGVAVGAFAVLTGLFAVGAMGGGDVKLLTALALWIKPLWFAHLLIVMALAGGILTVVLAFWHIARRQREAGHPLRHRHRHCRAVDPGRGLPAPAQRGRGGRMNRRVTRY